MKFVYTAVRDGVKETGTAEASDKFALAKDLKNKGVTVLSVEPEASKGHFFAKLSSKFSTISFKEKIFFIGNLSEMLSAGLSLTRALKVSLKQTKNTKMKNVIIAVTDSVDKGGSFAEALARFPKIFPPTTIAMVEAGEKSGRVPEALQIVSNQMLKTYNLRKKIRGALTYPAIVILAMIGIAVMMLVYIVPTLAATFKELGAELPLSTRFIIGFSDFLTGHYLYAILLFAVLCLCFYYGRKVAFVRRLWAWFLIHAPLFGHIIKETNSAVTARTLSSLLASGVDIVAALSITERVLQNPYYKEVIQKAIIAVPKGDTLSVVFGGKGAEKLYPPFVGEMMSVGEETGKLPEMLGKLAQFYENEVEAVVKDLSTIIEPLIMLFVGAGVGFFALAMIQPIYSVGNNL
ncbi:MAG TPA: type II secretion system F family protein [Candidatus Paceibacterota bacterium]